MALTKGYEKKKNRFAEFLVARVRGEFMDSQILLEIWPEQTTGEKQVARNSANK